MSSKLSIYPLVKPFNVMSIKAISLAFPKKSVLIFRGVYFDFKSTLILLSMH